MIDISQGLYRAVLAITAAANRVITFPDRTFTVADNADVTAGVAALAAHEIDASTHGVAVVAGKALAEGGTNKAMTAVNGGVVWTDADSMEVSAAGTSGQHLQSAAAAAPTWSNTFTPKKTFTVAPQVPASNQAAAWALDNTDTATLTIANNGTASIFNAANNFSGLVLVNDTSVTGGVGMFLVGSGVVYIGESTSAKFSNTATTAGKINLYRDGSSAVILENKNGSSINFSIMAFRTRAAI